MSSEKNQSYDSDFMSNFSPSLVHRIMLTPPNRLESFSFHGRAPTLTFRKVLLQEGYLSHTDMESNPRTTTDNNGASEAHEVSLHESISRTMMRAFHDVLLSQISQCQSYDPLLEIMLDIQSKLKSLVPHRKDLHKKFMVDLDEMKRCLETFEGVLKLLCDFAERLIQLESQERSVSTQDWMNTAMDILSHCNQPSEQVQSQPEPEPQPFDRGDRLSGQQDPFVNFFCHDESNNEQDVMTNDDIQQHDTHAHRIQLPRNKFIVASVYFVHGKIVQCQSDVADFQFGHFLAPKIRAFGIEFLKRDFEQRFGSLGPSSLDGPDTGGGTGFHHVPNMKVWLMEIIDSCSANEQQEFLESKEKRIEILTQRGWVDNLLFRSPRTVGDQEYRRCNSIANQALNNKDSNSNDDDHKNGQNEPSASATFFMPEIFHLDAAEVKAIRLATKISVVGSALALHATNIAGAKDNALRQDPLPYEIQQCRAKLVHAMGSRVKESQEMFEKAVGDAVIQLAKVTNPHFECNAAQEDIIRSRTVASMRGEDPVINLLDNRMRAIFRKMMVFNPLEQGQVPATLRTGRLVTHGSRVNVDISDGIYADALQQASKEEFINKGFSFYADELAEATVMCHNIISLAMKVHGPWVEQLFLELIQRMR
jgi:hypothetical protein